MTISNELERTEASYTGWLTVAAIVLILAIHIAGIGIDLVHKHPARWH